MRLAPSGLFHISLLSSVIICGLLDKIATEINYPGYDVELPHI